MLKRRNGGCVFAEFLVRERLDVPASVPSICNFVVIPNGVLAEDVPNKKLPLESIRTLSVLPSPNLKYAPF